jgi:hypothetical protein
MVQTGIQVVGDRLEPLFSSLMLLGLDELVERLYERDGIASKETSYQCHDIRIELQLQILFLHYSDTMHPKHL